MKKLTEVVAERLKYARETMGLTQTDVGEALGLSPDAISKIERGHAGLALRHLEKLPGILNHPIEFFLGLDDPDLRPDEIEILTFYRLLPLTGPTRRSARLMVMALVKALREVIAEDEAAAGNPEPLPEPSNSR